MPSLLLTLDLAGVAVFALSGALAAVHRKLDAFGVAVVGVATALGGGILRDVLLGATPPASLRDWRYLAVPVAASALAFWFHPQVARGWRVVLVLDAAGLALFTVTGTTTALDHGLGVAASCLLGMLTGIGGGVLRDLLLNEIPVVLRRDVYALVALLGAAVVAAAYRLELSPAGAAATAASLVFAVRLLAVIRHWSAPTPRGIAED